MKKIVLAVCLSAAPSALALAGCGGDDVNPVATPADASADHTSSVDGSGSDGSPKDGGPDGDASLVDTGVDAGPVPPRVLLSMNNTTTSELLALDLATASKNSLIYPGSFGTTFSRGNDPYVLEQKVDVVGRLDAREPWKLASSWIIALDDRADGGAAYSDPLAIAIAETKGYVARYTRNKLAVVDTTKAVDAGAPLKAIDLSGLVEAADGDGIVEATFAFYVASRHMVYVLLGGIDRTKVASDGYTILCATTTPLLVGIDTSTDQITSLGGAGPSGSIVLAGYNPAFGAAGAAAVYDEASDRLLVLHAGCNLPLGDGGAGAIAQRTVEEVALATGKVTTLLDASAAGFPSAFAYIGPHDAVLGLGMEVRRWDPTVASLGPVVANAPDPNAFAYAGSGAIVGTRTNYLPDSGTSIDVVRTNLADGGTTILATNPFTDNTGFIGGVEVWPPAK